MPESPKRAGMLAVALSIAILGAWGCRPGAERPPAGPPLKLTLAMSPAPYSGLIAIADRNGYFREAGLEVSLLSYPSGLEALGAMRRGEAQAATVACIAFASQAREAPSLRILASIGTTVGSQIVARRDRGIRKPSDLKGRRVGVSSNTISDYLLYSFLLSENIPAGSVTAVELPPGRQADAVAGGKVDAVSAFEINAYKARKILGDSAVSWDSQNNIAYHWLLVAEERATRSPEPLKRLLKALVRAERFARENEEESKRLLAREWGFDPGFLEESWPRTRLGVSFNQAIVTSLANYAGWYMRKAGKTGESTDVLNYLHTGILDEVAPEAVTVFR